jgi:hypothetical protein
MLLTKYFGIPAELGGPFEKVTFGEAHFPTPASISRRGLTPYKSKWNAKQNISPYEGRED